MDHLGRARSVFSVRRLDREKLEVRDFENSDSPSRLLNIQDRERHDR